MSSRRHAGLYRRGPDRDLLLCLAGLICSVVATATVLLAAITLPSG